MAEETWDPLFGDEELDGSIFGAYASGAAVIDVDLAGLPSLSIPQRSGEDALQTARFVWLCSVRFARILAAWALGPTSPAAAPGFKAVELGAGCGLCAAALAAARRGHAQRLSEQGRVGGKLLRFAPVLATDLAMALPLLHDTVHQNGLAGYVAAAALDWQQALAEWSEPPPLNEELETAHQEGFDRTPVGAGGAALGRQPPQQARAASQAHVAAGAAMAQTGAQWAALATADLIFAGDCTWSDDSRSLLLELVARACRAGAVALLMHEDRGDRDVLEKALAGLCGVTVRCLLGSAGTEPETSLLYMVHGMKPRLEPHALAAGFADPNVATPVVAISAR